MFDYTVYANNSPKVFKETCIKIKTAFPYAMERKLLVDVDGSTIQTYTIGDKDIDVYDDYEVGAVYVRSEINILDILEKNRNQSSTQ